jgi:hypothetical protein
MKKFTLIGTKPNSSFGNSRAVWLECDRQSDAGPFLGRGQALYVRDREQLATHHIDRFFCKRQVTHSYQRETVGGCSAQWDSEIRVL